MRDQEFTDLQEAYVRIWEQQVGVPIPPGKTAEDVLQKMIPRGEKVVKPKESKLQNAHYEMDGELVADETDLFDYILEYLVAEGYADTNESAIAIMANMSEEWRQNILVEKYENTETVSTLQDKIKKEKLRAELEDLQTKRNQRWAANELKPGPDGGPSLAQLNYQNLRNQGKDFGVDPKATEAAIKKLHQGRLTQAGLSKQNYSDVGSPLPASKKSTGSAAPKGTTGGSGKVIKAAGGKGGTVTTGTKYAATLGGKKGYVTYDASGKKTFTAGK